MNDLQNVEERIECQNSAFDFGIYSLVGTREYQQDYAGVIIKKDGISGIICDGMGGLLGGELASKEAVKLFVSDYLNAEKEPIVSDFLCKEAGRLDALVSKLEDSQGNLLKAGSTVVSVIVDNTRLYWMSVGDSRIYILREDTMLQVTKDHNYRNELNDALIAGELSSDKYEKEISGNQTEALISYLGMGGLKRIDFNHKPFQLEEGDVILLCSDGLYKSLEDDQILALLKDNKTSSKVAAKRLACMALEQAVKGQDNTTVLVIHYRGDKEERE